jgi:hypothetical protein
LDRLGIRVSARGDRLHFAAPKDAMTPDLKDALANHKSALLALVTSPPEGVPASEPRTWTAPDLTADEAAAVESILTWPLDDRRSWGELIEAGRHHNEVVMAERGRSGRRPHQESTKPPSPSSSQLAI